MSLVVQKYGGTSLADADRVRAVATRVATARERGDQVVVVVSAMGHTTDDLVALAGGVSDGLHPREMDMLLTAGERIAMALTAMAIRDRGIEAMSLTGSQAGILTDAAHGNAKITEIRGDRVRQGLEEGKVVIVAGFQGVDPQSREITTLGRGGSDATAVALAASLGAESCEIYTDVDGVLTADPRVVPDARKLEEVSYDEMLELAASGATVLMARSVEVGRRFGIPIHVRSSFHDEPGTWVKEETLEEAIVRGVSHNDGEAKITVHGVPDSPGVAASLFSRLAKDGIGADMIVQNVSTDGITDISFTIPKASADAALEASRGAAAEMDAKGVDLETDIARVSIVGAGMQSDPSVAARMFSTLSDNGVNIEMISTSDIRISCVVKGGRILEAVAALHTEFDPPAPT
ncbi:MAG: aspartate kinase [Acidimicrobiia bacterium]